MTTALQGVLRCRLALPAIPWLKVAGATYTKIGNCDLEYYRMFYNCLSVTAWRAIGPKPCLGLTQLGAAPLGRWSVRPITISAPLWLAL